MRIEFLSFPAYWWGRKKNKGYAFLNEILLFKKKKKRMCEKRSRLT